MTASEACHASKVAFASKACHGIAANGRPIDVRDQRLRNLRNSRQHSVQQCFQEPLGAGGATNVDIRLFLGRTASTRVRAVQLVHGQYVEGHRDWITTCGKASRIQSVELPLKGSRRRRQDWHPHVRFGALSLDSHELALHMEQQNCFLLLAEIHQLLASLRHEHPEAAQQFESRLGRQPQAQADAQANQQREFFIFPCRLRHHSVPELTAAVHSDCHEILQLPPLGPARFISILGELSEQFMQMALVPINLQDHLAHGAFVYVGQFLGAHHVEDRCHLDGTHCLVRRATAMFLQQQPCSTDASFQGTVHGDANRKQGTRSEQKKNYRQPDNDRRRIRRKTTRKKGLAIDKPR